ncbi:MAG: hypothetical protein WKG06_29020 [Segetibacter sp.]
MRKAIKNPDSKIITDNLKYVSGNSLTIKSLAEILLKEQKNFCAYTDEYISRTDARDIEHFNPTLKDTPQDNYHNWFIVKSINGTKNKSYKWDKFQPILHPTADDFEERIIYIKGDYFAQSDADIEAKNLINLLQLDNLVLADNRKKYIKRKRDDMIAYNQGAIEFFTTLINCSTCEISYLRAIKEEFGIDIWQILD